MATVTGFTADRMLVVEASSIVSGVVNSNGRLILTTHGGTEIDAGSVKGDQGDIGPAIGPASGDLEGNYPDPTIKLLVITDAKIAEENKDGLAETPSMRTLGVGAQQAAAGNDFRLSDTRTPSNDAELVHLAGTETISGIKNFTAAPTGITKASVGLSNVDNTSDADKPSSTADIAALSLKAPLASPAFTGTPTGITKTHIGLSNVDNTTDIAKPISTAQATVNTSFLPIGIRTNLGNPSVMEAALIDAQATNKIWFHPPENIMFENSLDDVTFTPKIVSDANKRGFLAANGSAAFSQSFPKGQYFRISITPVSYVYLNWLYFYTSSNGNSTYFKIEKKNANTGVWSIHVPYGAAIGNWPGHVFLPHTTIPFNNSTNASHYSEVRVTIKADADTSGGTYLNSTVYSMEWWGGYPSGSRSLFSWDGLKNAAFPAEVSAAGQALVKTNDSRMSDGRMPSNDAELVHLAGAETISGVKNFTASPTGITKASVGLGNVDNTSDINKPLSTASELADAMLQVNIDLGITAAQDAINTAASDKNKIYYQPEEPVGGEYTLNDTWFDTNDDYHLRVWNGTIWAEARDATIAAAQTTADGKNTIYFDTDSPSGDVYIDGDLWFDTLNDNKMYRYDGSIWLEFIVPGTIEDLSLTVVKFKTATHQLY